MGEENYDVLILGGGPAGISAGIWADELGLVSAIVDRRDLLGGQLWNVHNAIKNFPGAEFDNGAAMAHFMSEQLEKRSTKVLLGREVVAADLATCRLTFADGASVSGKALILATGVRRKSLNVPGEEEFYLKGILESGAKDPVAVRGKTVAVVGGGDSAVENALILSDHAKTVHLIHHRAEFKARTSFVERLKDRQNINILRNTKVSKFTGSDSLDGVTIVDQNGVSACIGIDHALIRIGYQPNSELFRDQIECDPSGYVLPLRKEPVGFQQIFMAGDLWRPTSQTLVSASADGVEAAAKCLGFR